MKYREHINNMKLEEKIRICSGADFWGTVEYPDYGIPRLTVADGPHGIRKQKGAGDPGGLYNCYPATCFPTAAAAACSWNTELMEEMGKALALEAKALGVHVILGPGVNIKRNPLCGRNFEYYSEDPLLSGKMGAALIRGIQENGVGACAKHFMGNNQETDRLICDDIMDEKALREIYLKVFEIIIKESNPASMMAAYNMINGTTMTAHKRIIQELLRDEMNYQGILMSDWGAVSSRVESFMAGLDLEMPGSNGFYEEAVLKALKDKTLKEADLDACVDRILDAVFTYSNPAASQTPDMENHHGLAARIAADSGVLMKNNGILPLSAKQSVALIGGMAEATRFQGSGSSRVTPWKTTNIRVAMEAQGSVTYAPGYRGQDEMDESLEAEAVKVAAAADVAVVVIGLSDAYESEGYDRTTMELPPAHLSLLEKVAAVNSHMVVVLLGGSPVLMNWEQHAEGILNMYLGGQAVGEATTDLLYGKVNPSGRLAETYPMAYEDVVCSHTFTKEPRQAFYDESIYCGYRYYGKAGVSVRYPFGHGLSYTSFSYHNMEVVDCNDSLKVTCEITNTGKLDGAEVVELYCANETGYEFCPEKELKAFTKVWIPAGETREVSLVLTKEDLQTFHLGESRLMLIEGNYRIILGKDSRQEILSQSIQIQGEALVPEQVSPWYLKPQGIPARSDFFGLLGKEVPAYTYPVRGEFTPLTPLCDMQDSFLVRMITRIMTKRIEKAYRNNPEPAAMKSYLEQVMTAPLQALYLQGNLLIPFWRIRALVALGNGFHRKK